MWRNEQRGTVMSIRRVLIFASVLLVALGLVLAPAAIAENAHGQVVRFQGLIESRPDAEIAGEWVVDGRAVQVTADTILVEAEGSAEVGARVMVVAEKLNDETLEAILIRVLADEPPVHEVTIRGQATEVAEDHIIVNSLAILITDETEISGDDLEVGAFVKVEAVVEDETITALRINVLSHHRYVEFRGEIESIADDAWVVDGKTVAIDEDTTISGEAEVGDQATVRAKVLDDGSLLAVWIRVHEPTPEPVEETFTGIIQRFPPSLQGFWLIGGKMVVVDSDTIINGAPVVGAEATVRGYQRARGAWRALEITVGEAPELIEFTDTVTRMPRGGLGRWVIGDWKVIVTPETEIEGEPLVGAVVHVQAQELGVGALVAVSIEVISTPTPTPTTPAPEPTIPIPTIPAPTVTPEETEFDGVIKVLPPTTIGLWKIGNKWVTVTSETEIVGEPVVGAMAHVEAYRLGGLIATRIEVAAAPEPTPTATPIIRQVDFTAAITRIPTGGLGIWKIGDYKVVVTPVTTITGAPAVGATAHVIGVSMGGSSNVLATSITIVDTATMAR